MYCYLPEGACAFRQEDFLRPGGYFEPFRIGGEGWDLSLRMTDVGFRTFYHPETRVRHAIVHETRSDRRPHCFHARNDIWTAFKDYTGWRRWHHLADSMVLVGFFCLHTGNLGEFFRGARDGLQGLRSLPRTPVSKEGWRRLAEITAHRPNWFRCLQTHWAQREI